MIDAGEITPMEVFENEEHRTGRDDRVEPACECVAGTFAVPIGIDTDSVGCSVRGDGYAGHVGECVEKRIVARLERDRRKMCP